MTTFKKGDIVRRKESHKDSWWSSHKDCSYTVVHDTTITDDTMFIQNGNKIINVYIDSMEFGSSYIDTIKETYLALLKLPICSWRVKHQHVYISLRNTIAEFEGKSIQEVQEYYEGEACKELEN